jgi:DNA-binding transcriptional LysR family regulator
MQLPLRTIATFVRCAETGSFSKAALDLGMTPQAVSSHIKQLEDWVGVRLFHRTTRKIGLTEEGSGFFEQCKAGIDSIEDGVRSLNESTHEAVGTVRMAVPYAIARGYITPILARFFDKYPRVSIELIIQNQTPDIVEQGVDLGISSGTLPASSMIARRLVSTELVLCASPAYIETYGIPSSIEGLHDHRCVGLRHPRTGKIMPWTFRTDTGVVALDINCDLITNDTDTQRQAVLHGVGIGQLASFFVSPHVRENNLVPLLMGYVAPPIHFHLYMLRRTQMPRKTRVLADFLYKEFRKHPDFKPFKPAAARRASADIS